MRLSWSQVSLNLHQQHVVSELSGKLHELTFPVLPSPNQIAPIMPHKEQVIPSERIEKSIFLIRGQKVMLVSDLAELYEFRPKFSTKQ